MRSPEVFIERLQTLPPARHLSRLETLRLPDPCLPGCGREAMISVSMKRVLLALFLLIVICCGCANQYVIKLKNGLHMTSSTKPKLDRGYYIYTDSAGKVASVPAG